MNFFHKTLIVSGLWLFSEKMTAQGSAYFSPADFEDTPITVPASHSWANTVPAGHFSFDCKIWLDDLDEMQPIFSKENHESGSFLSFFITPKGELAFQYIVGKTVSGKYESHRNLAISDSNLVKTGEWIQVAMVHAPRKTEFWVKNKPVESHFSNESEAGLAIVGNDPWLIGGVQMSPDDRPKTLRGRLDDVRFWRGSMSELYRSRPGGRPIPKSYEDWLLAEYDMESFSPHLTTNTQIIENRSAAAVIFSNGIFQVIKKREAGEKPIRIIYEEADTPKLPKNAPDTGFIAAWFALCLIAFYVIAIIWWVMRSNPAVKYLTNEPPVWSKISDKYTLPKNIELPVEFGQLWPGERLEFVVQTGSPVPYWRIFWILTQVVFVLFLFSGMLAGAFGRIISENESEQMGGIGQLLLIVGAFGAFLFLMNGWHLQKLVDLFKHKKTVVGTSDRIILGEPEAGNRTIFWEQIRLVQMDIVSSAIKLEFRTGTWPLEKFEPETFWLTNIENSNAIYQTLKRRCADWRPEDQGENDLNFRPKMTEGGPQGIFGPCELHRTFLYATLDFFGKNQLLMLRRRIKSALIEPYDIPSPGWAVVAILENGARFPLFFTEDLKEAKGAAAWFKI